MKLLPIHIKFAEMKSMNSLKTLHLRPQLSAEQTDVMEENGSQENNREHADTVRVEGGEV